MDDAEQAQRGAADPTASVWVAASAGTGKTKVLTDRVLNLMLAGTPPQRILCLTFTNAAAAEMRDRIARELGTWAAADDPDLDRRLFKVLGRRPDDHERVMSRQLFPRVLDAPGGLNIHTLHAFCQSLLVRFPLEAEIAPHFSVLDERDQAELMALARDEVLLSAEHDGEPGNGHSAQVGDVAAGTPREPGVLASALAEVTRHVHEAGFTALLAALAADRHRIGALISRCGSVAGAAAAIRRCLRLSEDETAETITAAACADYAFDALGLHLAMRTLAEGRKRDTELAAILAAWLKATPERRLALFDSYADALLTKDRETGQPKVYSHLISKKAAAVRGVEDILTAEAERVLAAVMKCRAATIAQATEALLVLGEALISAYQRLKEARAVLDYDDLIACTARLLEGQHGASWVQYKLDGGIDHVLIDEAQDTSPEQWRIVRALTSDFFAGDSARAGRRTVFAVGDVKQSIFSFQGAEPAQFVDNRDWFGERVRAAGQNWRPFPLHTSFRSTRAVLAAVDAVFASPDSRDGVNLDAEPIVHQAHRQLDGGSVEVWPPVLPRETDEPLPWKPPVDRVHGDAPEFRLAALLAERIALMTQGPEILESAGRPIVAGDIMVLVRRRTPFVEELVRQLKKRHVPVAGVDRMILTEQMAVMDLVALARFALLPEDDLTLATVLKGPLIGLDEEQLFCLAHNRKASLWRTLRDRARDDRVLNEAHSRLAEVLAMADAVPPFEFFATVLGPSGGRHRLLARLGRDAEDPLAEFLDLALAFERIHAPSLQGFLHWLEAGAVEIKRDLEQAEPDAVRVMTIHGAKGLQAPIVFLPDTMQVPRQPPTLLWPMDADNGEGLLWPPYRDACDDVALVERNHSLAKQEQEYRRLLYVAMTRARDRLVVCGWRGKQPERDGCWYRMILRGLEAAEGLGLHRVEDPFLAAMGETETTSVVRLICPQEEPPQPAPAQPSRRQRPLPQWARTSPSAEPEPPQPLAPSRPTDEEPALLSPLGEDGGIRFKRGTLIHRLLQHLPELPPERRADAAREWLTRPVHGLSTAERDELLGEVLAVIEYPEWQHLFAAGSRAEVAIAGAVGAHVISGQIDRLLITPSAVTVLDFKSDREPPRDATRVPVAYCRQMAAYRAVLQQIYPDRRIRCVLLWTQGPHLTVLDDSMLDAFAPA